MVPKLSMFTKFLLVLKIHQRAIMDYNGINSKKFTMESSFEHREQLDYTVCTTS